MKYEYCPKCGRKLINKYSWDEGGVPYCEYDDLMFFEVSKPCMMVAVIRGQEILLLKQSYIFKDSKVLLAGYVTTGESVEETVHREVMEEVGLKIKDVKYLGSEYLASKEIIMLTFMATYDSGEIIKSDEVEWVGWSQLSEALSEMNEDNIGKRVVEKVLKELSR